MTPRFSLRAALAIGACAIAIPSASFADSISISPRVIPVGKWAEGIAFDGNVLWVAESGQRTIAKVAPQGGVISRQQVGRLPVEMVFHNSTIYALVRTDRLVWQQLASGAGRPLSGLDGCPDGLAAGGQHLWVLTEPNCSSDFDRLIRVDPATNERRAIDLPFDQASAVAAGHGHAWVVRSRGQAVSAVNAQSLAVRNIDLQGAMLAAVSANGPLVYVAGSLGVGSPQGLVAAVNPATMQEVRRHVVDQSISAITSDGQLVVAVGNGGKVYVLSASDFQLLRTIDLSGVAVRTDNGAGARGVVINGDNLYISAQQQFGENGAILVLNGWRPAAMPVQPSPPPGPPPGPQPPAGPPVVGATDCPYQVVSVGNSTGIWMYQDPDLTAPKVEAIPADAKGLVADRCLANWCHVTFRGKSGWVQRRSIQAVCN